MAKKLTSLLASVLLFTSNSAYAKDSEPSKKTYNNEYIKYNLKEYENKIKKANNNLTTENLIIYLFGTLFLGGGLYYGVPYCRELYRKYVPVKPLNLGVNEKNDNIASNFKHEENEYERNSEKYLGAGAQGSAWLFKNKKTNELVVVKKILDKEAQECEKLAYDNRAMLSACEYFCKPLDFFEENGVAYAVYEYVDNIGIKGLSEIIKQGKNESLLISELFCQLFEAVKYLKDKGFSHNDLLIKNILFIQNDKKELRIKIVDYGAFKKGFDDKIKGECSVCYLIFPLTCKIDEFLNRNDDPWPKVIPDFVNFVSGQNLNETSFNGIRNFFKKEKKYKQISDKSLDEVINFFRDEIKKFSGDVHK